MVKPVSVKILEWWFGVLAGLASLLPLPVVYGALLEPGLVFSRAAVAQLEESAREQVAAGSDAGHPGSARVGFML